mmetsp:Transcript_112181/g.194772  ORF Transcript_112181/g.194772 Transcript_112181/m.194772 type:complete len:1356 (-) Transcript_112181:447-4514(-)
MDLGSFLRLMSGEGRVLSRNEGTGTRSQNHTRVVNAQNLGPSVQWVFDEGGSGFTRFVPDPDREPRGASPADRERDLGNEAYKNDQYELAVRHYTNAIHLDKDNHVHYSNRCAAYINLGRLDDALHDANKTISMKPDWPKGYSRKGSVLYKQGRYMLAAAAYSEALTLDPNNAEIKKSLSKSEAAYRRELVMEQVKVDVGVQTCEVDESNIGAVIRGGISMGEGAELLQKVVRLRRNNLFYDPSADILAKDLQNDRMVSMEFDRQLKLNKETIRYEDFCKLQKRFYDYQAQLREEALSGVKERYDQVLLKRNDTEGELLRVATASLDAYHNLADIERQRSEYIRRACSDTQGHIQPLQAYINSMDPGKPPRQVGNEAGGARQSSISSTGSGPTENPSNLGTGTVAVAAPRQSPDALAAPAEQVGEEEAPAEGAGVVMVAPPNTLQPVPPATSSLAFDQPRPKRARREPPESPLAPNRSFGACTEHEQSASLLAEYAEWKKQMVVEVVSAIAGTNVAANAFYKALRQEAAALEQNLSLLARGPDLLRRLTVVAQRNLEQLQQEDVSVSLQHLRSQQADFESAYTNLLNIAESRRQAAGLLQEDTELEKERLALEKRRIKVQAEADWLKVQGEDGEALEKAVRLVSEYKERIGRVVTRQGEVSELLSDLANSNQPELLWSAVVGGNSSKNRHLKWIKGSGTWMNRSLMDFDIKTLLGTSHYSKVFHATHYGHDCVLKEIPMETDEARKALLNEVKLLTQVQHPSILQIKGVFQDGPMAYIVMPYYSNGTISQYLDARPPKMWELQEMLRQITSGVATLHEHRIIHRDLKPTNVLMNGTQPLISDFGIAKDISLELGTTTLAGTGPKGTRDYLAPEVLEGGRHSPASDVWALGILFYDLASKATSRSQEADGPAPLPVLMPGCNHVQVPAGTLGNERLERLVESMLQRDPVARPTAQAVLAHPYFAVSLLQDMSENHTLMASDQKLAAFASFLQQLRSAQRQPLLAVLDRNNIMESMADIMDGLGVDGLARSLQASFRDERAVDEGGVTSEMYTLYFTRCVARDVKLFIHSEMDGKTDPPSEGGRSTDDVALGVFYLPNPARRGPADLKAFNVFGRVLVKSLMDNAPCPFQPSIALLKFLLGLEVGLTDLEQYDRVYAHRLRDLLITKGDVAELELDFSGLVEGGEDILVTNENREDYVSKKVQHLLVGQRREQLEQIKAGFYCNSTLTPHLQLMSPMELMIIMCGSQHIKAELLIKQFAFRGFPVASKTPTLLVEFVRSMTQNNLRRFLRLTTASCVLPYRGLQRHISVVCIPDSGALPVGHTCSVQLDLPDYNDEEKLRQKLGLALAHADDPFGYA